jgi:myb proto-oncogene protein
MGNQKQKWTAEEEEALQVGVQRYGAGKWKNILRDPELQPKLISRSNIDLKVLLLLLYYYYYYY